MGSMKLRAPGVWELKFNLGFETDPTTGQRRRKVTSRTVKGSKATARAVLRAGEVLQDNGGFVTPSKTTVLEYLRRWYTTIVVPMRRPHTQRSYHSIIENHVATHQIALLPLQKLVRSDVEGYLASRSQLAASSLTAHAAMLHAALRAAIRDGLLTNNPAHEARRRPASKDAGKVEARRHCWEVDEVRRFLAAATQASPQVSAFCHLAIDSGARRQELSGLLWTHLDFQSGALTIEQQLDQASSPPVFGPPKSKHGYRTLTLVPETLAQLRRHRQAQLALKMRNRVTYVDHGLIFAKEHGDCVLPGAQLGHPMTTLTDNAFRKVVRAAGLRRIKFHGCRHSCATMLLHAGIPPHEVAARLGHTTQLLLSTYAHPSAAAAAATRAAHALAGLLYG